MWRSRIIFRREPTTDGLTRGWYRRQLTVDSSMQGKELYLVFEGAATLADVYVNGQHLGQHRGAYTRFVFDATKALHVGTDNQLAVLVNDSPADTKDCLPWSQTGLYKIWGGLYRNVWLVATSPVHIDPTDFAAPGVYLTPKDVSADSAGLEHPRALAQHLGHRRYRREFAYPHCRSGRKRGEDTHLTRSSAGRRPQHGGTFHTID